MKAFFSSKIFKISLACGLIILGVSVLTIGPINSMVSETLSFITIPMQEVSNKVSNAADEVAKTEKTSEEYEAEIKALKEENQKLRALTIDYFNVKKENTQYLKFYEIKKQNESLKIIPGSVAARDPNDIFYGFTLDKGKKAGIQEGDPVMTENGIVGWVSAVGENYCKVKTILSGDTRIGALDKNTMDTGVITGDLQSADSNLTKMLYLSSQNKMAVDDIVVTTGLGGVYPKDMPIGKVKEIKIDDFDSSYCAVIEPFDDIRNLYNVFVVLDFEGKGEISKETIKPLEEKKDGA